MRTMNTVAWILGIILAGGFGVAGVTKLLDLDRMRDHLGYSARQYRLIGLSEVAGAAGVVIGLVSRKFEWVALTAGAGICCLLLGALIAHARVEDESKKIIPAVVTLVVTAAFLITISLR
ncbi:DoxX family protein [bacterium]|jgi:uncharacterized membrane protein YphA (DoxX/SURF4 family)|nr:DoxX family protein [bacterium]